MGKDKAESRKGNYRLTECNNSYRISNQVEEEAYATKNQILILQEHRHNYYLHGRYASRQ